MNILTSYELKKRIRNLKHKLDISKTIKGIINIIIVTIIATIIATIAATAFIDLKKEENDYIEKQKKLLYNLQTICIGCNKEWMDSVFGMPVFTNIDGTIKEEVYITDIALNRAFFDIEDDSCVMFFVTQTAKSLYRLCLL